MLITVQPDPNWQLSLAQLSPSLSLFFCSEFIYVDFFVILVKSDALKDKD